MLLLVICIVYMFVLAANKLLVDKQENLEIQQEKVSTLSWQINERDKTITQLKENIKSKNLKTFIIDNIKIHLDILVIIILLPL